MLTDLLNSDVDAETTIDEIIEMSGFDDYEHFRTATSEVSSKNQVVMKRDVKDVWVNGYNADLLRAWGANLDIQYILDPYACIMYIVSYISKSEHELGEILKAAQEDLAKSDASPDLRAQMKKLGTVYFDNREVSIQEAVVRTCDLKP